MSFNGLFRITQAVPTGMKAGVRMIPRGVEISPWRAEPLVDKMR